MKIYIKNLNKKFIKKFRKKFIKKIYINTFHNLLYYFSHFIVNHSNTQLILIII